jgi:hypothetical protein
MIMKAYASLVSLAYALIALLPARGGRIQYVMRESSVY